MFKLFILVNFLLFLVACKVEQSLFDEPYKALICREIDKSFKKYIFHTDTGYLYFYSKNRDDFIPFNLKKEAGSFINDIPEVFSSIKKNKLVITGILYSSKFKDGYHKTKRIINLDRLSQKILHSNEKNDFVVYKSRCNWIDPKTEIKIE
tara:strand:+ start:161 stop:610 length:450 start_codon:yes stop_codon:yes gene_type:complete